MRPDLGPGTLALVTATVTGIITSMTIIGPLLVDLARDLGVSLGQAGLLAAVTGAAQALSAPFAGLLSDRLGRRPMIVVALAGNGVMAIAAGLAPSFLALAAVRFAAGILGALAPASLAAALGDLCRAERLARAMSWFNLGFSFAAIGAVPLVSALGGALGWRWAFATTGVMLLALALGIRLWFPGVPPLTTVTSIPATYRALSGVRGLPSLLVANMVERSLFMMVTIYLPGFLMLAHGMTTVAVAPVLSVVALGAIAGNVLGGQLGDRWPRPAVFIAAQLVAGLLGLVLFGAGLALPASIALAALLSLANSLSRPGFLAYGAEMAPRERGVLFGLVGLSNQVGVIVGSAVGAAFIGGASYTGFALVVATQGVVAALLAVPLLRIRRGADPARPTPGGDATSADPPDIAGRGVRGAGGSRAG
jgi:predicted MFS family arabinose efflux permease